MDPQGKYLIAMNKWSIDRHTNVGPLHPQNFQLIDISGAKMELLADMPIGFGEPHYAQIVKAETIKAHAVYQPGESPATNAKSPDAIASEKDARIVRRPGVVEVWMNVVRSPLHARHRHRQGRPTRGIRPTSRIPSRPPTATHGSPCLRRT
jgi:nitrous-oxide reductase